MKILLTGGTGYVGSRVESHFEQKGVKVRTVKRFSNNAEDFIAPNIDSETDWTGAFSGVECVIHCAAKTSTTDDDKQEMHNTFNNTNFLGTLNLAQQASLAGVKKFIFLSSVKAQLISSTASTEAKQNSYDYSKYLAEKSLQKMSTDMEIIIIRSPLVYGPGVKGNFFTLLKIASWPIPLPLGSINNQRSLVYIGNLIDFIFFVASQPSKKSKLLNISDDHNVSTSNLLQMIAEKMNKSICLIPAPRRIIFFILSLCKKLGIYNRLFEDLTVDISEAKNMGWNPPVTFEEAIEVTVQDYLQQNK
ncbi:NAD-dependent epimerase/dehydratase family protein [Marinomonas dokdonensis]|uniref:NAD-dependent epimerase/dehydratase family protein n=1 Tax=Marinomonas dokdonensis TaxID=328224 RepID=UPI0040554096